ncbi:neuropeptide SIFamide [Brevipalpus obovatus]|uniref:neuropeptide SIFamide n=1 Tax=Brevipalpus obovatus TaxID=246614 RepID=UPI003D9EE110
MSIKSTIVLFLVMNLILFSSLSERADARKPPLNGSIFGKRSSSSEKGLIDAISMCQALNKMCSTLLESSL